MCVWLHLPAGLEENLGSARNDRTAPPAPRLSGGTDSDCAPSHQGVGRWGQKRKSHPLGLCALGPSAFSFQKCTTGAAWHGSALRSSPKLWLLLRANGSMRWWGWRGSQTAATGKGAGLAKHATCSAREEQPAKRVTKAHERGWVQWMLTLVIGTCALDVMSKRCDWCKDTSRSNFMLIYMPTTFFPPLHPQDVWGFCFEPSESATAFHSPNWM